MSTQLEYVQQLEQQITAAKERLDTPSGLKKMRLY